MTPTPAQIAAWRRERARIRNSMEWAYAMGHGCSMGFLPLRSRAVLQREQDLAALIQEHDPARGLDPSQPHHSASSSPFDP